MKEAMQLDATLQLPDGKQIPVVVELDATQLETSLADTGLADVVARAVEVLGSRRGALACLRPPGADWTAKLPSKRWLRRKAVSRWKISWGASSTVYSGSDCLLAHIGPLSLLRRRRRPALRRALEQPGRAVVYGNLRPPQPYAM